MTRIFFREAENGSKGDDGAENGAHDRTKEGAAAGQRGEFTSRLQLAATGLRCPFRFASRL